VGVRDVRIAPQSAPGPPVAGFGEPAIRTVGHAHDLTLAEPQLH
jgi:hypothetical protein